MFVGEKAQTTDTLLKDESLDNSSEIPSVSENNDKYVHLITNRDVRAKSLHGRTEYEKMKLNDVFINLVGCYKYDLK